MEDVGDFMSVLRGYITRARRTTPDLARLTGLSANTLRNWIEGKVQRPRLLRDVLLLARALELDATHTTTLLTTAGHPPLNAVQTKAQQTRDPDLLGLLTPWEHSDIPPAPARNAAPALVPRHQLRPPSADFVGRDHEITQLVSSVRSTLTQGRSAIICAIQGMGGCGKTELALVVAHHLRDVFPDAQIVLALQGASPTPLTAAQAIQTVLHALTPDARLPDDLPALEQLYRSVLYRQRALILADDAADAAQVRALIPPVGSALLLTSRTRFTLPGIASVHLDPLTEAQAVILLRQIYPRLNLDQAHALARACGYLPLALRVSGSILHSTPALAVWEYLARLANTRQRLSLLCYPDDPHLDVEAALTLSYTQLTPDLQAVFRQLSVFVTDFATPLALAVVVTPNGGEVLAMLHHLLRRNLVLYDPERERWRLHDLVRDIAWQRLETMVEANATQWRYARAAVQIARATQEQYVTGGDIVLVALAQFDAERPHIDAASRWAVQHAGTPQGDQFLVDTAAATDHFGWLRYDVRRERIPLWERALIAAKRLNDRPNEGLALRNLGLAYTDLGEPRRAIPYYEQYLSIAHALGDQRAEALARIYLGRAYADLGDTQRAIPHYEDATVIARTIGDQRAEALALNNLGSAYAALGDFPRAITYYEDAAAIASAIGDRRAEGLALGHLGLTYTALNNARRAIPYYDQCLIIVRALGDQRDEGYALYNLGYASLQLGEIRRAIEYCEGSYTIARAIEDRRMEGYALSNLARAWACQGDMRRASTSYTQALTCLQGVGDRWGQAESSWLFGLALVHHGERERALPLLRAAVAYEQEIRHAKVAEHAALLARLEAGEALPPELHLPAAQPAIEDNPETST